jgi:ABC-2 type transport system ATP-binding protein
VTLSARTPAIRIRGLIKKYGDRAAVDELDLEVPQGVVYGFLGPNGAGKTTTMRILVGLIRADAGSVELFGNTYAWGRRQLLHDVGALIEAPAFLPYLSGRANLRVVAGSGPAVSRGRVDELLEFVGLGGRAADRYGAYSQGMRQRLGIAAALLNDPSLLLLDEPVNGIDPAGIADLRSTFRNLAALGKTVFVSSHILPEVQQLADTVGIINHGRLVRQGPLEDLLAGSQQVRIRVPEPAVPRAIELLSLVAGAQVDTNGHGPGWLTVNSAAEGAPALNRALVSADIDVLGLEAGSDLEAIFLSLTESGT